ncbi:uncharacterized protein [Triticum aestivum]|uniref:uncharacterized protein isoform X1 n=1 Tax=Triticum aestivum TaxID=4565 RepID=UPI000842DB6A|nr:uncharacterized protein LOC123090128 isoform X1 [Triticum aestivum]
MSWTNPSCFSTSPRSLSSPQHAPETPSPPLVDPAATGLPSSRQEVQENRRCLLRLPRALNRARKARTLAIDLVFNAYIAGVRRRLPPLRSTSGLPDLAFVLTFLFLPCFRVSKKRKTKWSSIDPELHGTHFWKERSPEDLKCT